MIQNISQKRADKRITANDLRYIYCLALQTLYPADTLFYKSQGYTFGHFPYIALYYIKGIENGKASCSWRLGLWPDSPSTDPTKISCPRNIPPTKLSYSLITPSENVSPSNIYETLKINEGEEKIIIECLIFNYTVYKNLEGKYIPAKEALGLKLLSPKAIGGTGFLNSVVIFTPKPGLFSETAP